MSDTPIYDETRAALAERRVDEFIRETELAWWLDEPDWGLGTVILAAVGTFAGLLGLTYFIAWLVTR